MVAARITKTLVEQASPSSSDTYIWDSALKGFGLKVTPHGKRVYLIQYRPKGQSGQSRPTRRYTIGPHGAPWTTEKAREAATQLLARVRLGEDPQDSHRRAREAEAAAAEERRRTKAEAKAAKERAELEGYERVVALFIQRHAKLKNRRYDETSRILLGRDFTGWHGRAISTITRADVRDVLEGASARSQGAGRLAFAHARKFFNWCVENAYLEASPCSGMKGPPAFKARDRYLNDDELRLVWRASNELAAPFGAFIKMLILTAQRRDEVARMAWSELDLDHAEWTIPSERCKNGKAHVVDLSPAAIELIRAQDRPGELLFTTTGSTPISGFAKVKRRLDEMVEIKRAEGAKALELPAPAEPIPAWRVHDLRRTAATGMARLGNPPWVVEAVLNHISGVRGGLVAVYQHYEHRPERKAALRSWSDHVLSIVS